MQVQLLQHPEPMESLICRRGLGRHKEVKRLQAEPHKQVKTPEDDLCCAGNPSPAGLSLLLCLNQLPTTSSAAAGTGLTRSHSTHSAAGSRWLCSARGGSHPSPTSRGCRRFWCSSASCKGLSAICRLHVLAPSIKQGCLYNPRKTPSAAGLQGNTLSAARVGGALTAHVS